jgi:hypothetical protein
VASCIAQLDQCLSDLPRTRRFSLDRALFLKPGIETDDNFKLTFLRADQYDTARAARRLAKYFDDKLSLFGEDKLVKKITMDDLSKEDMEVFDSGFMMSLPYKDSTGRPIWFCDLSKYDFNRPKNLVRTYNSRSWMRCRKLWTCWAHSLQNGSCVVLGIRSWPPWKTR